MNRLHQVMLVGSVVLGSWLGMQGVHELGHVFGAWLSGGRVARVVLHPLTISRTDLAGGVAWFVRRWGFREGCHAFAAHQSQGHLGQRCLGRESMSAAARWSWFRGLRVLGEPPRLC